MKTILLTTLGVALGIGAVLADSKPGQPKPPTGPTKGVIPVILKKDNHSPQKYVPSLGITMMATVSDDGLVFNFPFSESDYPITVELELLSEPYGYRTVSFSDSSSCELEFDVTVGDYHLSVVTSENAEYSGYFTLE